MTDILDLEGWNVIAKRIDGDDYLIEAEYTTPQPDRTAELAELRAALQRPDRAELQAEGKHPAPCAKFCEAKAFGIDIRTLKAEIAELKADRDDCLALAKLNLASELKYKALCDQLAYVIENSEAKLYNSGKEALTAWRAMKGDNDGHRSRLLG